MYLHFTTLVAAFLLVTPAYCAPSKERLGDACIDVQRSSLQLNKIAKHVSLEARNGSKDVTDFLNSFVWMEAKDGCDPSSLKKESGPCIMKIFAVLKSYSRAIETVGEFLSCSKFANKLKPALHKLHTDMELCIKSKNHQEEFHISTQTTANKPHEEWQEVFQCQYTMERLFSFSILTARVFALGDPANHKPGPVENCM